MRVAAVTWKLREIKSEAEFFDHLRELLDRCRGCDLIVLPELFSLELLSVYPVAANRDIPAVLRKRFSRICGTIHEWRHEERQSAMVAVGSHLKTLQKVGGRETRNACPLSTPETIFSDFAHKVVLTEWEKCIKVRPGAGLFLHAQSGVGVTICLDAEFPASGRALAEAGMLFQCVPAWTETMHGFQRVRWACQARAVENQVCVIHSSLVGKVGKEESHGSSAIIVPPHAPFPLNPILAETAMDEEGVAIAEVDPADLLKCREQGEVRNWRDRDAGDWTVTTV